MRCVSLYISVSIFSCCLVDLSLVGLRSDVSTASFAVRLGYNCEFPLLFNVGVSSGCIISLLGALGVMVTTVGMGVPCPNGVYALLYSGSVIVVALYVCSDAGNISCSSTAEPSDLFLL